MNIKYFKNISNTEYELLLHGVIGEEINGVAIAAEIHYLNTIGATVIKERINTIGGSVVDAFSIVSANLASKAEIHTFNEGVSDSAGSFILASGDKGKRGAMDYSTMMVHNPSFNGVILEDVKDKRLKKELLSMRDSIVTILTNNSNKTKDEITNMMLESRRMSAVEAKSFGFIDFIETSIKKPALLDNMSLYNIMNICNELKHNRMKNVLNYLNLNAESSENSAIDAIKSISDKVEKLENKVSEKDIELTNLKEKIAKFEAEQIENAVCGAIESGKFNKENKADLISQAETMGLDNFNLMIGMVKLVKVDVISKIDNKGTVTKQTSDEKLAAEYQDLAENDSEELFRIKNIEPNKYEEMFNAWNQA